MAIFAENRKKEKQSNIKKNKSFNCCYCGRWISLKVVGARHRNHCPFCLWSIHVDLEKSGDRKSKCYGTMEPIALTFKQEGLDKYNKPKQGELMVVHRCVDCGRISINRIAGDDNSNSIIRIFEKSKKIDSGLLENLEKQGINPAKKENREEILTQLFGKNH